MILIELSSYQMSIMYVCLVVQYVHLQVNLVVQYTVCMYMYVVITLHVTSVHITCTDQPGFYNQYVLCPFGFVMMNVRQRLVFLFTVATFY